MENHFNQGYMPSYSQAGQPQQSLASFGNLSNPSHQQDSPSHTTLPPLQPGYQFGNLSYGHPASQTGTPTTPHTPSSSSVPGSNHGPYPHLTPTNTQPGSMLPPSSFNPAYNLSQSLPYPSSTSTSLPSATSGAPGLPSLRPMPPSGLPSLSSTGQIGGPQPAFMQNEEAPTHVVGSQGRRGILPSAPGRPNPPAQGAASTKSMIPQKDADGKYPCPHCNKTYLHAKHLKRHLLRHTGDRPYMCHLCKDTFSRSDILKRHFQKCSIRRGNPTGANHLAHQRRNTNNGNRLSISQTDGPIGLASLAEFAQQGPNTHSPIVNGDMSGRTSRANSMISPNTASHRNSIAGLGILGSNVANSEHMASSAALQSGLPAYAGSSSGPMQSNYAFSNPQVNGTVFNGQQQGMSFLGQQNSRYDNSHNQSPHQQMPNGDSNGNNIDWNRMFNQGGQDSFIGTQSAKASSLAVEGVKKERESNDTSTSNESFLGNLYSHPGAFGFEYDGRKGVLGFSDRAFDGPLQEKVDSLIEFCFPVNGAEHLSRATGAEIVKSFLNVAGLELLDQQYPSFQEHWPMLHMPTFKLTEASNALVMAMLCVSAIYSQRLDAQQVRGMMDFIEVRLLDRCSIYHRYRNELTGDLGTSVTDLEELQALLIVTTMFVWHGGPAERKSWRDEFVTIVGIAKAMGLCDPASDGHYAYSVLHASSRGRNTTVGETEWDWYSWLEQEKRNRLLYLLFLTDVALAIFFNCAPQFDTLEIRLMLPADDAAWDAETSEECASALGLHGAQAQTINLSGTKRLGQPGLHEAMRTLLEPSVTFLENSTNAYSKFILIHAVISRIVACQKASMGSSRQPQYFGRNSPATPLLQHDWLTQRMRPGSSSSPSSGQGTPIDIPIQGAQNSTLQQERKKLGQALDKWKRSWDADMIVQFEKTGLLRIGYCRDGAHLFYLGRSFLQSQDADDWTASADARFLHVLSLLKSIRGFATGEHGFSGQEIGSVGNVDELSRQDGLELDMTLLFRPFQARNDWVAFRPPTYPL